MMWAHFVKDWWQNLDGAFFNMPPLDTLCGRQGRGGGGGYGVGDPDHF